MRDLSFSFMSFHLTNKCITDSLCRDWNDSTNSANKIRWTDAYSVFMMMMLIMMILGIFN